MKEKEKQKDRPVVFQRLTLSLASKLTDEQRLEKGRELANVLGAMKNEEANAEAMKRAIKSAMAALEARRDLLQQQVQSGEEMRDVEVEDRPDWETLRVSRVRMDTSAVIHDRAMNPEEKQMALPLEVAE